MGTLRMPQNDWMRRNQQRYLAEDSPQEALDAAQHVLAARAALTVGEVEVADFMYRMAQRLWKNMDSREPGRWAEEIIETSSEMTRAHLNHH